MNNRLKKIEIERRLKIYELFAKTDKYYAVAGMSAYLGIVLTLFGEKVLNEWPLLTFTTLMIGASAFISSKCKKYELKKELSKLEKEDVK